MPLLQANAPRRSNPHRQSLETRFLGGFETLPYSVGLGMTYYLALHHPLILTVPDLRWWLSGSSFTRPAARRWLQLCEILVLLVAAVFEPSPLIILLLRRCFSLLGNG